MAAGLYSYLSGLCGRPGGVLDEMEEFGRRRRFPVVGPLVGRVLQQLVLLTGARRVLELGSGFGYSAAWFLGASPDVHITCIDSSRFLRDRGCEFLGRLGVGDRADFLVGDALALAAALEGPFDIVFCDIDKNAYCDAFRLTVPRLRKGGVFVADNALWRGYAWSDVPEHAPEFRRRMTAGVREFNRLAHSSREVLTTVLPLRDGLSLSVRR